MRVDISSFNLFFVLLSFMVSVFGSFVALQLGIRIPTARGGEFKFWLISAATALGGGAIWSMHFIGMIAFKTPFIVNYDPVLTVGSLVIAVIFVALGLWTAASRWAGGASVPTGGVIAGLGVSAIHYMGMAAMRMPATIEYDTTLVIASVVIGVVAAAAALWLAFNHRGALQRFVSAFVMGIAVCGMHYTAMFAVTMKRTTAAAAEGLVSPTELVIGIFFLSFGLLVILLLLSELKRTVGARAS